MRVKKNDREQGGPTAPGGQELTPLNVDSNNSTQKPSRVQHQASVSADIDFFDMLDMEGMFPSYSAQNYGHSYAPTGLYPPGTSNNMPYVDQQMMAQYLMYADEEDDDDEDMTTFPFPQFVNKPQGEDRSIQEKKIRAQFPAKPTAPVPGDVQQTTPLSRSISPSSSVSLGNIELPGDIALNRLATDKTAIYLPVDQDVGNVVDVVSANITPGDSQSVTSNQTSTQYNSVTLDSKAINSMLSSEIMSVGSTSAPEISQPAPNQTKTKSSSSKRTKSNESTAATKPQTSSNSRRRKNTPDSPVLITPVEAITTIVGDNVEKDTVLKEVISKPIKHFTDINADSAHNRSVKNAINARVNRRKHKNFVQSLEEENSNLKQKIEDLERYTDVLKTEKGVLEQEIFYLKSVIANETTIGSVLNTLTGLKDVRLSSGFWKAYRKRAAADSTVNDSGESKRTIRESESVDGAGKASTSSATEVMAGVCLHVHDRSVSVEFCEQCANMAASGRS